MKIATLTLNPAFDLHLATEGFAPFAECRAEVISRDAGGKGVNVSRALSAHGVASTAFVATPDDDGGFIAQLEAEGLSAVGIQALSGRIRENITLHEEGMKETRISLVGGSILPNKLNEIEDMLSVFLGAGDILVFAGSLPKGVSTAELTRFLEIMSFRRLRLILDSNGVDPRAIVRLRPFLMKPNEEELFRYVGTKDPIEGAMALHDMGVENAVVTLGDKGAVLACREGLFRAACPKINALSTVGAGDSSIAGFVAAFARGLCPEDCLRYASATGSAACLVPGTAAPRLEDIERLVPEISVEKL